VIAYQRSGANPGQKCSKAADPHFSPPFEVILQRPKLVMNRAASLVRLLEQILLPARLAAGEGRLFEHRGQPGDIRIEMSRLIPDWSCIVV